MNATILHLIGGHLLITWLVFNSFFKLVSFFNLKIAKNKKSNFCLFISHVINYPGGNIQLWRDIAKILEN